MGFNRPNYRRPTPFAKKLLLVVLIILITGVVLYSSTTPITAECSKGELQLFPGPSEGTDVLYVCRGPLIEE